MRSSNPDHQSKVSTPPSDNTTASLSKAGKLEINLSTHTSATINQFQADLYVGFIGCVLDDLINFSFPNYMDSEDFVAVQETEFKSELLDSQKDLLRLLKRGKKLFERILEAREKGESQGETLAFIVSKRLDHFADLCIRQMARSKDLNDRIIESVLTLSEDDFHSKSELEQRLAQTFVDDEAFALYKRYCIVGDIPDRVNYAYEVGKKMLDNFRTSNDNLQTIDINLSILACEAFHRRFNSRFIEVSPALPQAVARPWLFNNLLLYTCEWLEEFARMKVRETLLAPETSANFFRNLDGHDFFETKEGKLYESLAHGKPQLLVKAEDDGAISIELSSSTPVVSAINEAIRNDVTEWQTIKALASADKVMPIRLSVGTGDDSNFHLTLTPDSVQGKKEEVSKLADVLACRFSGLMPKTQIFLSDLETDEDPDYLDQPTNSTVIPAPLNSKLTPKRHVIISDHSSANPEDSSGPSLIQVPSAYILTKDAREQLELMTSRSVQILQRLKGRNLVTVVKRDADDIRQMNELPPEYIVNKRYPESIQTAADQGVFDSVSFSTFKDSTKEGPNSQWFLECYETLRNSLLWQQDYEKLPSLPDHDSNGYSYITQFLRRQVTLDQDIFSDPEQVKSLLSLTQTVNLYGLTMGNVVFDQAFPQHRNGPYKWTQILDAARHLVEHLQKSSGLDDLNLSIVEATRASLINRHDTVYHTILLADQKFRPVAKGHYDLSEGKLYYDVFSKGIVRDAASRIDAVLEDLRQVFRDKNTVTMEALVAETKNQAIELRSNIVADRIWKESNRGSSEYSGRSLADLFAISPGIYFYYSETQAGRSTITIAAPQDSELQFIE